MCRLGLSKLSISVHLLDPSAGQIHQRHEVGIARQAPGLEVPDLAAAKRSSPLRRMIALITDQIASANPSWLALRERASV
jgi:hypothetical protein